jgi:outer membrane biosynthesis protein TonB
MHEDVPTRPANHSPNDPDAPEALLWLVSYADDDDREMTAEEIFHAMRRGEIDTDTIVWRDGMSDWLPVSEVAPLQRAIEQVAGRRPADNKRTVMGGFQAQPPAGPPRPEPQGKAPRSTLIGTGAHAAGLGLGALRNRAQGLSRAVPNPNVQDLDDTGELDSELLESVRPMAPVGGLLMPDIPSDTATAPLPGVAARLRAEHDDAISLNPDSIESLPSNALESVVAPFPPMRSPSASSSIFDVSEDTTKDALSDAHTAPVHPRVAERPRPPLRDRSVMPQAEASTTAGAVNVRRSGALLDPSVAPPRKRGGAVKVLLMLLLLGGFGAAVFYAGRQTAPSAPEPLAEASEPAAPEPVPTAAAADTEAATASASAAPDDAEQPPNAEEPTAEEKPAAAKPTTPSGKSSRSEVQRPTKQPSRQPSEAEPTPTPKPAAAKEQPEPSEGESAAPGPFNTSAASAALTSAAGSASSCRKPGDPSGVANVTVTFSTSGRAVNANVSGPPFAGTQTGGCIASKMRGARVPPFTGDRITVKKVVVIQ